MYSTVYCGYFCLFLYSLNASTFNGADICEVSVRFKPYIDIL